MAVAGTSAPALKVARVNGHYYIVHSEGRPVEILADVDTAATLLLSGASVWIKAADRASLAAALKADIRSVKTRGTSNGTD